MKSLATRSVAPSDSAMMAYRTLVGVGLCCAVLMVTVHQLAGPRIAANRAHALGSAVLAVLPGALESRAYRLNEQGAFRTLGESEDAAAPGEERVFAGYDEQGQLVGVALEAAAMGYQDTIRLLYGYAPARRQIVGMRVLESRETPGLGDRIEKDASFLQSFLALDVSLAADGTLLNPIGVLASGRKPQPGQIDVITGATVSSRAVATALRESTGRWVALVSSRLEDFRK